MTSQQLVCGLKSSFSPSHLLFATKRSLLLEPLQLDVGKSVRHLDSSEGRVIVHESITVILLAHFEEVKYHLDNCLFSFTRGGSR